MGICRQFSLILLLLISGLTSASTFVDLQPAFIVNYNDGKRLHYLKVEITLQTTDDDMASSEITYHADYLRHKLIMLLSSQKADNFSTIEGKEKIKEEALVSLQEVMVQETGKPMIDKVLFTSFVVQ
ncbi:flagellar basal body-associated FliL family protein [Gynuella sunshinyii]|uniref:Flagellar protein FliL n=1 Tax=Gynuella sunshinyii YC6258 TaxID=1445510 RepID=A0A0C5VSX2_9GAMM|nr:flagellar basal body-associated FliL family protein [Gynuella sunshinyii]AJQ97747.1 flagellar basal body-associated protein [Gynuella sunshinyii YC6258]